MQRRCAGPDRNVARIGPGVIACSAMAPATQVTKPDFAQLYAQLGLHSDCSLEDFKHACRRRIAELHPDRIRAGAVADDNQIPFNEFLALYAKVIRFHHQHGRLPGAAPSPVASAPPPRAMQLPVAMGPEVATADASTPDAGTPSLRNPLFVVLGSAVVLAALSFWGDGTPTAQQRPLRTRASEPAAMPNLDAEQGDDQLGNEQLELGMDRASVLAIQGEPMRSNASEWEYGPSWLRFEGNRLVDWYSSPLHPLKTTTAAPSSETDSP